MSKRGKRIATILSGLALYITSQAIGANAQPPRPTRTTIHSAARGQTSATPIVRTATIQVWRPAPDGRLSEVTRRAARPAMTPATSIMETVRMTPEQLQQLDGVVHRFEATWDAIRSGAQTASYLEQRDAERNAETAADLRTLIGRVRAMSVGFQPLAVAPGASKTGLHRVRRLTRTVDRRIGRQRAGSASSNPPDRMAE